MLLKEILLTYWETFIWLWWHRLLVRLAVIAISLGLLLDLLSRLFWPSITGKEIATAGSLIFLVGFVSGLFELLLAIDSGR
jgi:hypothetical protein